MPWFRGARGLRSRYRLCWERVITISSEQLHRNQLLFREVNERIREIAARFGLSSGALFVCECERADCMEHVELELDEYDAVRARKGAFIVAAGHESARLHERRQ